MLQSGSQPEQHVCFEWQNIGANRSVPVPASLCLSMALYPATEPACNSPERHWVCTFMTPLALCGCVQAQMEEVLFQIMHSRGFTDTYVRRFRMVTRFHLQRRPLVIFISGTACTGVCTGFRDPK